MATDLGRSVMPMMRRHVMRLLSMALVCLGMLPLVCVTTAQAELPQGQATHAQAAQSDGSGGLSYQGSDYPATLSDYVQEQSSEVVTQVKKSLNSVGKDSQSSRSDDHSAQTQVLFHDGELMGDYDQSYHKLTKLNEGLPKLVEPYSTPNLDTPLALLEYFQTTVLQNRHTAAAYALNLNSIPDAEQTNKARELTRKLDYLLAENQLYQFDDMPDRPDGLVEPPVGSNNSIYGIPRRSIKLGNISFQSRSVPIYIERVKVEGHAPMWVFSQASVDNIDMLYEQHKPAEFEQYLPAWLTAELFTIAVWELLAVVVLFAVTFGLGWLFNKTIEKLVKWYVQYKKRHASDDSGDESQNEQTSEDVNVTFSNHVITDLASKLIVPLTASISFATVFTFVSGGFPFIDPIASSTRPIIWVALVYVLMWLGIRIINFFANRYQDYQIDRLDDEQFVEQRQRRTYLSVFRRLFIFFMIIVGFWVSLSEFTDLEGLGTTLLTSAGIAGAVIGIAAQSTLGNIIAGVQVALTQPVRIGDTVIIDGVWSSVEDLRYTYAVIKTWDDRRLIVPMKHLVTEIIENRSHTDPSQAGAVYLYVDYGADIDAIRQKFIELVKAHDKSHKDHEPEMLVTEVSEHTITLRGKVVGDSPDEAWALECDVREKMLHYLATEHAKYLPIERMTVQKDPLQKDLLDDTNDTADVNDDSKSSIKRLNLSRLLE